MATPGFSLGTPMGKLTPQDMGVTDYAGALSKGMDLGNKPFESSKELLNMRLKQALKAPEQTNYEKALKGYYRVREQYGEGSPQEKMAADYVTRIAKGGLGITILDPKTGQPMVQIGGQSDGSNPFGGSGGKSGSMKPGQDFVSGNNQYQTPTTAMQTQLQNRVVGQEIVAPYVDNIVKTLPQFQSKWVQGLSGASGFANKWLGTDFDLPSQYQKGQASLGLAAEGMLRQFGLNATGKNLDRMEKILTPDEDESAAGFKRRATEQAQDFLKQALIAQDRLTGIQTRSNVNNQSMGNNNQGNLIPKQESPLISKNTEKKKYNPNDYDIPEGYIGLYKNGELYFFPPDKVDSKIEEGYSYE